MTPDVVAEWTEMMRAAGYNMDQPVRVEGEPDRQVLTERRYRTFEDAAREEEHWRKRAARARARRNRYYAEIERVERMYDRLFDATWGISVWETETEYPIGDHWRRLFETGFHIEGMPTNRLHPPHSGVEYEGGAPRR